MIWLWLSAAFMVTTAGVHSIMGYRRMIVPLLRSEAGPLANPLTRRIIRFAWHATSVLMLISAAAVAWPGTPKHLLLVIGGGWLAAGLFDAAYTKGGAGILAVIGALT